MMARLRMIPVLAALTAAPFLAGCSGTTSSFDPTEWFNPDFLSTKTPLPGERKAVFPEGVPGVTQGVPKELVKGSQQQQQAAIEAAEPPAEAEPAKPAPKPPAARPAPKPRTASAPPPATRTAAPQPRPQQQPQQRPAATQPTADWPDGSAVHPPEQPQRPPQAPAASGESANWPPPDSSTFSR